MKPPRSLQSFQRVFEQAFRSRQPPIFNGRQTPTLRAFPSSTTRRHSTESPSSQYRPLTDRSPSSDQQTKSDADAIALRKAISPAYQLWFTCKKCLERSGHTISKQAYHFGTCVINCPKCKSQHLISDHLKIFEDKSVTLEEIAKRYGEKLRKGRLGADGDVEFYEEGDVEKVLKGERRSDGDGEEGKGG